MLNYLPFRKWFSAVRPALLTVPAALLIFIFCSGFSNIFYPAVIRDLGLTEAQVKELTDDRYPANEKLNGMCDRILNVILEDGMSETDKASAIYTWVCDNYTYVGKPDFSCWQEGAWDMLSSYSGDCYGYYASLRALLQRAGIRCLEASSVPKDHYWVMASVDGNWRHLDATPGWGESRCLLTTQELLDYVYDGNPKYPEGLIYEFDPSGYPVSQ